MFHVLMLGYSMAKSGCSVAKLGCSVAIVGCCVAKWLMRWAAVRQSRVRFPAPLLGLTAQQEERC
jgi:hypothetical protein